MRQKKMLGKPNINVVFLLFLFCLAPTGCGENSIAQDGDVDIEDEIDSELDAEHDRNDVEVENRERPENPVEVEFPKTLWRDEVETGNTFTWGFLPRDYFPIPRNPNLNLPIVWDNVERRILAIDSGAHHDLDDKEFVLYTLTEQKSGILAEMALPDAPVGHVRWSTDSGHVNEMLLVNGKLLWSFYKSCYYMNDVDFVVTGILSYDLHSGETRYIYWSLKNWSEIDIIGAMSQVASDTIMLRRKSGFQLFNIDEETIEMLQTSCRPGQEHFNSCVALSDPEFEYLGGFSVPGLESTGLALFDGRLISLEEGQTGDLDLVSFADYESEKCKNFYELEECKSSRLRIGSDCCLQSRRILNYLNGTYIHSHSHSTFFKVDLDREGFDRKAGRTMRDSDYFISPDGTPATEAYMGGGKYWLITDDGDLMWVSTWDYSVRGIAGPLDQWAE